MKKKRKDIPYLVPSSGVIDTHCHLDMEQYSSDLETVIAEASAAGVKSIITIGIDLDSTGRAIQIAQQHAHIYATAGIHPHDAESASLKNVDTLGNMIEKNREHIVAFGEIGLDYAKLYCPIDTQQEAFRNQLSLARELNLPVIIHDREAHDDILRILTENGPYDNGGIMHCFSGDIKYAKKLIDLGFTISIPGIVTFKKAHTLQEVAKFLPLDRIILETDGPFLAPEPFRGKRNEPKFVLYTAEKVAELRAMKLEDLALATTVNAQRVFNISI